jgi:hypothetical protein
MAAGLLLLAACGGGGGGGGQTIGQPTDPRSVPTATPWSQPPDVIILDPNALTPISAPDRGGDGGDGNGDVGTPVAVTPVTPFQITSDESTNRRTSPSREGAIAGTITKDQKVTVTGQVSGDEVDDGNNIWYELDDGSFVYSGAVKRVE